MSDSTNRKIMLADVINNQDVARTGFKRLLAIFTAIQIMTEDSEADIAALAKVGADISIEFASAAESARDDYARLLEQAEGKRHG